MNKGLEVNVEIGLCTKDMAKENPIKDFEILIEEYKDKWSTQMYDYFKECLNEIKKKEKALEIVKDKGVNVLMFKAHFIVSKPEYDEYQYYLDNCEKYGFSAFYLTRQEFDLLKEVLL